MQIHTNAIGSFIDSIIAKVDTTFEYVYRSILVEIVYNANL